ncbi:MAG: Glycosyltransferase [Parcubacteria bacterium C7867-003]|nr:MAG: Glycosyltransferase [Parcubacteria bacterium C7867-003]
MKINYITNVRVPTTRAQGYAIFKMCEQFGLQGADVSLFVPRRRDIDNLGEPFSYYKVSKTFELVTLNNPDFLSRTLLFSRFIYWVDMFLFLVSVKRMFKNNRKDLYYTRDFLIALALPRESKIYLEIHDIPGNKILFIRAINRSKTIIVLNNNLKKFLVDLGVSEKKIFISPSSVEISEFNIDITKSQAREMTSLPQDKKIILYTGHLYPWKGADILAESAINMPENIFVFVGGVEPELSKFREKYHTYKNIIIRPFEPRSNIPAYLKSADVLVIPSPSSFKISSEYTSPVKMFEYMASGTPIVASSLPSLREILNDDNCVFAIPDDSNSLCESINKILRDDALAGKISSQASTDVLKYTWDNRAKGILAEIQKTTGEPNE